MNIIFADVVNAALSFVDIIQCENSSSQPFESAKNILRQNKVVAK